MRAVPTTRSATPGWVRKQRGVGEYTIEIVIRQIELQKILLPNFATAVGTRHVGKMCSAFQTDRDVTEFGNHFEVSPGPAAKIKYVKRGSPSMYCNIAAMFWLTS